MIGVRGRSVFVDLGAKSEGIVPLEQFEDKPPVAGDMIDVVVDRFDPDEGLLLLSLKGAAVEASWENLARGSWSRPESTKSNKGGLEVEVDGIRGFLPISQIDINRVEDASVYIGQKLRVIVTEADQRQKNLVVSRRELPRTRACRAARENVGRAGGRASSAWRHSFGQALRRLRRPGWYRRAPARRRHELDPSVRRRKLCPRRPRRCRSKCSKSTGKRTRSTWVSSS